MWTSYVLSPLQYGVDEDVGHLLSPGEVGGAEGGEPDHGDPVLLAETPATKSSLITML